MSEKNPSLVYVYGKITKFDALTQTLEIYRPTLQIKNDLILTANKLSCLQSFTEGFASKQA